MIIVIIALATIAVFISWLLIKKPLLRVSFGLLSLLIFAGSITMLTNHFVHHTGMTIKTTKQTRDIFSAAEAGTPFGLLITQEIGSSSGNYVLIYRDKVSDKEATAHFVPKKEEPAEAVKQVVTYKQAKVDKATLTTITKRYTWSSDWAKLLYGFGGEDQELVSRHVIATVPNDTWLVLTKEKAEQLPTIAQQLQEDQRQKALANPQAAAEWQNRMNQNPKAILVQQVEALKKALNENN